MVQVYATPADHLTYYRYRIRCSEAAARLPTAVILGEVEPIYDDLLDPGRETLSVRTIVGMCELVASRIPFTIIEDLDVLTIVSETDAYLNQVRNMVETEELRVFLSKLIPLRDQMIKLQHRILRKHPDWNRKYQGLDSGYLKTLHEFMSGAGSLLGGALNPTAIVKAIDPSTPRVGHIKSLSEQIAEADERQRIAEQYAQNPASVYSVL